MKSLERNNRKIHRPCGNYTIFHRRDGFHAEMGERKGSRCLETEWNRQQNKTPLPLPTQKALNIIFLSIFPAASCYIPITARNEIVAVKFHFEVISG
jgi:hypothetical protein